MIKKVSALAETPRIPRAKNNKNAEARRVQTPRRSWRAPAERGRA